MGNNGKSKQESNNRIYVRSACWNDIPWIIDQLGIYAKQFDYKHEYIDAGSKELLDFVGTLVVEGVCFVTHKNGEQTGAILGRAYPHPLNPKCTVLGLWSWWVAEKYRKTRSGYLLLKEFVDAGKKVADVTVLTLRNVTPVSDEGLEYFGLFLKEKTYVRENDRAKDGVIEDDRYDDTDDSGRGDCICDNSGRNGITDDIGTIDRRY